MKKFLLFVTSTILLCIVAVTACKEENGNTLDASQNKSPIANAGPDLKIDFTDCSYTNGTATLDGSKSYDPNNNITVYSWVQLYGPSVVMSVKDAPKALLERITAGDYAFELTVRDAFGLLSKDTVLLKAVAPYQAYDLDVSSSGSYFYIDNFEDCYYGCTYYDNLYMSSIVTFPALGDLNVFFSDISDTSVANINHNAYINIFDGAGYSNKYFGGSCSIDFEKLMRDGGGPFSGSFKVESSSAQNCVPTLFQNLPALEISGNMDTLARGLTFRIKGKIYF